MRTGFIVVAWSLTVGFALAGGYTARAAGAGATLRVAGPPVSPEHAASAAVRPKPAASPAGASPKPGASSAGASPKPGASSAGASPKPGASPAGTPIRTGRLAQMAPADAYFGPFGMSPLSIRTTIGFLGRQYHYRTISDRDLLRKALLTEDALRKWRTAYPADPWLAPTFFHLEQLYQAVQTEEARKHATAILNDVIRNYPDTKQGHLSRSRLTAGFPALVPETPLVTPSPTAAPSAAPPSPTDSAPAAGGSAAPITPSAAPAPNATGSPAPATASPAPTASSSPR